MDSPAIHPMRRAHHFRMPDAEARAFLAAAPFVHLATSAEDGAPILRAVHGVVLGDHLYFHAAPAGEKMAAIGRPAVVAAEEVVAEVPSYFSDEERACPATTLYRSAQLHATLEAVADHAEKARALQALMTRYQPEGGHRPIDPTHPRYRELYRKAVDGLLVARLSLDRLDGKAKLLQNRSPEEVSAVCERMWRRGHAGDARAVELVRRANPGAPTPPSLAAPEGAVACTAPDAAAARDAAALLDGTYWNAGLFDRDTIRRAHLGSPAWVTLHDATTGALLASARALADGAKIAWVLDVIVDPARRGRGLGRAVTRLLLDHPAVRGCRVVRLKTRDAQRTYEPLGFRAIPPAGAGAAPMEMQLVRG